MRVPLVVAMCPRQNTGQGSKGSEEVVECPRQDDVVIDVEEEHNQCGGIAYTWWTQRKPTCGILYFVSMTLLKINVYGYTCNSITHVTVSRM